YCQPPWSLEFHELRPTCRRCSAFAVRKRRGRGIAPEEKELEKASSRVRAPRFGGGGGSVRSWVPFCARRKRRDNNFTGKAPVTGGGVGAMWPIPYRYLSSGADLGAVPVGWRLAAASRRFTVA